MKLFLYPIMLTIQILPSTIILEALQSQPQFHLLFTLMPLQLTVTLLEQIFSTSTFIQYSLHPLQFLYIQI